jgi:uncharacterized protein YjbI with pentapeptide repeats
MANDKELDRIEALSKIAKLQLEGRLLEQQVSRGARLESLSKIVTAGGALITGVMTALVAFVGLYISSNHWLEDSKQTRLSKDRDTLQRSLQQIAGKDTNGRLAGVVGLSPFIASRERELRNESLLALSYSLALEDSPTVRHAILASFESIDPKVVGADELEAATAALVRVSRGLVNEGRLRQFGRADPYFSPQDGSVEARARSVADSLVALIGKGARNLDFSGSYLVGCDFKGRRIPGASFNGCILAWSDFTGAYLANASFKDADLTKVRFTGAVLSGAHFNQTVDLSGFRLYEDYVEQSFNRSPKGQLQVFGPDFSCADLRGSEFSGHPVFAIYRDDLPELRFAVLPARFEGAQIERADFRSARAYGVFAHQSESLPFATLRSTGSGFGSVTGAVYEIGEGHLDAKTSMNFSKSLSQISQLFAGSTWRSAFFPQAIRDYLEGNPPVAKPGRGDPPCSR